MGMGGWERGESGISAAEGSKELSVTYVLEEDRSALDE